MRVVIHKKGFTIEAFTFFIMKSLWKLNESSSLFLVKKMKKKVMLKLEENERWRRWKNSENGESDYVQMIIYKEVKKDDLEEVLLMI